MHRQKFLQTLYSFLLRKHMTKIGPILLDTIKIVCVKIAP